MIAIVLLVFLVTCGIAGYFIAARSKKRPDGSETRSESNQTDIPKVGRATGRGDD